MFQNVVLLGFQFSMVRISCVPITCERNMKSSNLNKCEGSGRKVDGVSFVQIFVFTLSGFAKSGWYSRCWNFERYDIKDYYLFFANFLMNPNLKRFCLKRSRRFRRCCWLGRRADSVYRSPRSDRGQGRGEAQPELSAARPSTYYWLYIQRYQYVL